MNNKCIYDFGGAPNLNDSIAVAPEQLVQRHARPGMSLLAVLHAIQDELSYVPPAAVAPLARAMNLSRAEVHGVITYYHHFRTQPAAAVTVQLCRAEACRSMGTEALAQHIEAHTGCRFDAGHAHADEHVHEHDAAVELESVYCLGQCALSPALMLNGTLHAKVTPQKFDAIFAAASKCVEVTA